VKRVVNIAALILLALLICWAGAFVWIGGPWSLAQANHFRKAKNADQLAIARAAVATIRKHSVKGVTYSEDGLTNLPPAISALKPKSVSVRPDGMRIEFHGGFDHFGFEIREREDVWEMSHYTEQSHHLVLTIRKDEGNGTQAGPANGNQPMRSETSRTGQPAGSHR